MFLTAVLLIILGITVAFYLYAKKCNEYWKRRGVPIVKLNFIYGMSFDYSMERGSLGHIYERIYSKAGSDERYVGFYSLLQPCLLIRDPQLINQITVRDFNAFHDRTPPIHSRGRLSYSANVLEGEEWEILRRKMTPIFTSSKLRNMYNQVQECADSLMKHHFRHSAKTGEPLEMKQIMGRYSLDVVGKCAFGLEFNSLQEDESVFGEVGVRFDDRAPGFKNELRRHILFDWKALEFLGLKVPAPEIGDFFFDLLNEAKKLRRKESVRRVDFLQTMLDLVEDPNENQLFTENHIASNMFSFYISTYDMGSLSIAVALYELAMQPAIQEKLRQEIEGARDSNNGLLDYNTLNEIAYLEMVISETLRLHPPMSYNFRACTAEKYQVPDSSLELQNGEVVTYSISAIHKDERYFPNPLKFDPERFSKENIAKMNPYAYQPFGSGPRICLGLRFAKLMMKVCLASVILHFRVVRSHKTESPIVFRTTGGFLRPKNGIWLSVEEV